MAVWTAVTWPQNSIFFSSTIAKLSHFENLGKVQKSVTWPQNAILIEHDHRKLIFFILKCQYKQIQVRRYNYVISFSWHNFWQWQFEPAVTWLQYFIFQLDNCKIGNFENQSRDHKQRRLKIWVKKISFSFSPDKSKFNFSFFL